MSRCVTRVRLEPVQDLLEALRDPAWRFATAQWFELHDIVVLFMAISGLGLAFVVVAIRSTGLPPPPAASVPGRAAVVAALGAWAAQPGRRTSWMAVADLAQGVGASGPHDHQYEADIQALYEAGSVLLTSSGPAASRHFAEAMLAPSA